MTAYASKTTVPVEKSKAEIERILTRYGVTAFAYGAMDGKAVIEFTTESRRVRFVLPLPDRDDPEFTKYRRGYQFYERTWAAAEKQWEQACRQRWRALTLIIKAKLESVTAGITTLEDEFLAQTVLPDNTTVGETIHPRIDEAYRLGEVRGLLALGSGST